MSIQKIHFDIVDLISVELEDGRVFTISVESFPDIQKLPLEKRKRYTIVNGQTVLFRYSNHIYNLEDFIEPKSKWLER